jgi:hypothetical protein
MSTSSISGGSIERELELQTVDKTVSVTMPQADGMILAKEEESDAET